MEPKIKQLIHKVLNEGIEYIEPESSSCDCSKQIKQALIQLTISREELKRNPNSDNDDFLAMLTKIEKILNSNITEGEDDDSEDEPKSSGGGDAGQKLKSETDLVLTPKSADIDTVVSALENMDNYGMYLSNLRNTKAGLQKAIDDHFGPSVPMVKRGLEKKRGKPFAVKSKQAIDDFIKSFSKNTNILSYNVEGNSIRFPSGENATPATLKNIIKTVMDKAGIDYKLDSKETLNEQYTKAKKLQRLIKKVLNENSDLYVWERTTKDGKTKNFTEEGFNEEIKRIESEGYKFSEKNSKPNYKSYIKVNSEGNGWGITYEKKRLNEDKIPGGLAKGKTVEDIAKHYGILSSNIKIQLEKGIKVEMEHTTDRQIAKEIAMDHLWEDPMYYTKLNKMEKGDLKEDESLSKIDSGLAFKIYDILKSEFPEITKKYPLATSFFYAINNKL